MTNDNSSSIVSKVWNYAHVLKNAGVGYGDYAGLPRLAVAAGNPDQPILRRRERSIRLNIDNLTIPN